MLCRGADLHDDRDCELLKAESLPLPLEGQDALDEWQHCGCDCKCSQQHKVCCEDCVDYVLWQELEECKEPHQDCTAYQGKFESILEAADSSCQHTAILQAFRLAIILHRVRMMHLQL